MSATNNGGPAFPTDNAHQSGPSTWHEEGMTLRDYFAARAISLASEKIRHNISLDLGNEWPWGEIHFEMVAEDAYKMADAMLKAREA